MKFRATSVYDTVRAAKSKTKNRKRSKIARATRKAQRQNRRVKTRHLV